MCTIDSNSCVYSVENFISYFGLDKDPSDPTYQPRARMGLCHVVNAILHILKRSKPVDDITDPKEHPTYFHVLPVVVNFCIPLLRYMVACACTLIEITTLLH